ncbi:MAG: biotin synthase, partial [Pseudomonadota bacterium]|nr:biotin synthase [Pseudomonadota bacterium]
YGEKLLTTGNPDVAHDRALFERLGLNPMQVEGLPDRQSQTLHVDILEATNAATA